MKYEVYTKENGLVKTDDYFDIRPLTWHRLDGPALICYNEDGTIDMVEYYINDKALSFEEWKGHPSVKAKTIEVDSKKELDTLVKKDKEGTKTDDYFISSTGKYPVVYTLKESKVFESFKDKYIKK